MIVKRNKGGVVAFATAVSDAGYVEGWSPDKAAAVEVDQPLSEKIKAQYAKRPNAGTLTLENATGKPRVRVVNDNSGQSGRLAESPAGAGGKAA